MRSSLLFSGAIVVLSFNLGCQTPFPASHRPVVDADLACRTNHALGPQACPGDVLYPEGLSIDDGVTADKAVTVALWNNAAFQELLSELGVSRAQLFNAGLLPDPLVQMFFPLGPKQFELTAFQSLDALWLRPIRKRAAQWDLDQLSQRLIQDGLNVIRDARLAHADLLLAQQQLQLATELLELRQEIARLAKRRNEAGAISELEAVAPDIESLQAEADVARLTGVVQAARARLLVVMGLDSVATSLIAVGFGSQQIAAPGCEDLVTEALASRPDLIAAELAMYAAAERVELAKKQLLTFEGIFDFNSRGRKGAEASPGLRLSIPIFNRNRGNIAIAEAQYEMAARRVVTLQNQIRQDVMTAHANLQQALGTLAIIENKLLPATRISSELARKNFEGGGASYVLALQTLGQDLTAQVRQAELQADVRRALAELERSVSHEVYCPTAINTPTELIPLPPDLPPAPQADSSAPAACRPVSHRTR